MGGHFFPNNQSLVTVGLLVAVFSGSAAGFFQDGENQFTELQGIPQRHSGLGDETFRRPVNFCAKLNPPGRFFCELKSKQIADRWRKRDSAKAWEPVSRVDLDDRIRRFLNYRTAVSEKANSELYDPVDPMAGEQHGFECCPTKKEIVEPRGGITREGKYVHLVTAAHSRQRFYEERCDFDRLSTPVPHCRNVTSSARHIPVCVQKYGYSYALVTEAVDHSSLAPAAWYYDKIRVHVGCSCEVYPIRYFEEATWMQLEPKIKELEEKTKASRNPLTGGFGLDQETLAEEVEKLERLSPAP